MFDFDGVSSYVLTLGLLTIFVLIWVTRQQKSQKDAAVWLISGVVGVLLGAAGAMAGAYALGYQVTVPAPGAVATAGTGGSAAPMMRGAGMGGAPGGPRTAASVDGMSAGAMPMMAGGGGGGGQSPRPKQQLTTLIRKLELLTGDVALTLTDDQHQVIAKQLDEIAELKTLTDDEAESRFNDLLSILDDAQKAKQDAIGLPVRRGGGGGGGGFGGGGAQPAPDANPFETEANANALKALRERLTAK